MTLDQLNTAIERDVQLHEEFYLYYTVDGWAVGFSTDDGNTYEYFYGETPVEAMIKCFSEIRNKRGRI